MRNILVRVYILNEIVVEMNNVIGMGKLLNMKRCRFIVGMSSKYFFFRRMQSFYSFLFQYNRFQRNVNQCKTALYHHISLHNVVFKLQKWHVEREVDLYKGSKGHISQGQRSNV